MVRKPPYLHQTPWKHTCGITLVDLAAKNHCLFSQRCVALDKRNPSVFWDLQLKNQIPLIFDMNDTQTPNCRMQKAISFSTLDHAEMPAGFRRTPRTSKLFWCGESVHRAGESAPARMMRQESCQLPFSCRSSEQTRWHNTHSLSGNSGFYTAQHCC